jgi:hypothetical protein
MGRGAALDDGPQVCRALRVGLRQGPAEDSSGTPGPEQGPDDEAHRAPDGHVLDADQTDLPPGRADDVEENQQSHGEPGLTRCEGDRWRYAGSKDRDREQHPQEFLVRSDEEHQQSADREPDRRADQPSDSALTGAQSIGAQHRQRAQHDPERVLYSAQVRDQHGTGERDRAADAVA